MSGNYNQFLMAMTVTPHDWVQAVANAQPKSHQDGDPYTESFRGAIVRVLRQVADQLDSGDSWPLENTPIHINAHLVGFAKFSAVHSGMVYPWKRNDNESLYTSGNYDIEKVWAPGNKGFGWYATGPDWDGGFFNSLVEAKDACAKHESMGLAA